MTGNVALTFSGAQGTNKAGDFSFLIDMDFSVCNRRGAGGGWGVGASLTGCCND